jgi:hypothetical protein
MAPILVLATMSLAVCGLAEQAFATTAVSSASAALPDSRAYELVSTSGLVGEPYRPTSPFGVTFLGIEPTEHPFQAAEDGERVSYVGEPPSVGGMGETGPGEGNQWLATRTAQGWTDVGITPATTTVEFNTYQAFSGDLSAAIFRGGVQPLAPGVPRGCRTLYSRAATSGAYQPLFTVGGVEAECGHPAYIGAAAGGSSVIFQSEAALTENATEAELPPGRGAHQEQAIESGEPCMFGCNLYIATNGTLQLVNVLEGKAVPDATFGGYPGKRGNTDYSNAISTDGSRIFWTDTQPGPNFEHVFVLENGTTNVQVSGPEPAHYWTATPDGHFCLYTEEGELWRFDTQSNTRERVTAEGAGVLGVIGTNQTGQDLAYTYFVAEGVLAANKNANGDSATNEEPNVYLEHEGVTTFIATLSLEDNRIVASEVGSHPAGDWKPDLGERTAAVTPDGRHLVFESDRPLTGYDNELTPSSFAQEVFLYAADEAQLSCVSCDPAGSPPSVKLEAGGPQETRLPESSNSSVYMRRWISENGNRVFFDSEQPLVPQDENGTQDVYEWEREGEGTCSATTPARPSQGCVSLLSGGNNRGYSFLVDADLTGDNVFLEHQGPLGQSEAPIDRNELYDVRVNGGFQPTLLGCGTGCAGSPAPPPSFAVPASFASEGEGSFPPPSTPPAKKPPTRAEKLAKALRLCRKEPKHHRVVCEHRARQRYGVAHRATADRSRRKGSR